MRPSQHELCPTVTVHAPIAIGCTCLLRLVSGAFVMRPVMHSSRLSVAACGVWPSSHVDFEAVVSMGARVQHELCPQTAAPAPMATGCARLLWRLSGAFIRPCCMLVLSSSLVGAACRSGLFNLNVEVCLSLGIPVGLSLNFGLLLLYTCASNGPACSGSHQLRLPCHCMVR